MLEVIVFEGEVELSQRLYDAKSETFMLKIFFPKKFNPR